jgi:hypothetical protein
VAPTWTAPIATDVHSGTWQPNRILVDDVLFGATTGRYPSNPTTMSCGA